MIQNKEEVLDKLYWKKYTVLIDKSYIFNWLIRFRFVIGTFANCIKSCEHDAIKLMVTIHDKFQSYHDVVKYGGRSGIYYWLIWWRICDII